MAIHGVSRPDYSAVAGYGRPDSTSAAAVDPPPLSDQTAAQDPQTDAKDDAAQKQKAAVQEQELTQAEAQVLRELKQVDTEVRRHEMAHIAAGGGLITSGASFTYKRGPDGKNYAVAGEVSINTSPVPGDPKATLQKMQQVKSAALAPANPSAQDLKVASRATVEASKAQADLAILVAKKQALDNGTQAPGSLKQASDRYIQVQNLPETGTSRFQIAG